MTYSTGAKVSKTTKKQDYLNEQGLHSSVGTPRVNFHGVDQNGVNQMVIDGTHAEFEFVENTKTAQVSKEAMTPEKVQQGISKILGNKAFNISVS